MQRLLLFAAIFPAVCIGRSAFAVSGSGDVVGKVTVGYQGWFACTGDGSPMNNGGIGVPIGANRRRPGLFMNDTTHLFSPAVCLDVINWFKSQVCYLIGGVRRDWRTANPSYLAAYHAMNMIPPLLIGAVGSVSDADNIYNDFMIADQADCNASGVDYQPCVLPGDVSIPGPRSHCNLMWRMFYNATRVGCQGIYHV